MGTVLLAASALLTGVVGVSRRKTQMVLGDVLGKRLSLGTIFVREEELSEALAAPMTQAHDAALAADVKHLDETGRVTRRPASSRSRSRSCRSGRPATMPHALRP